ncbi:TonB-dependent receptor [Rheinheimera sp.]|uniref:TonB-dependent receptor n=1 Tax=Rheinheimera sp. TaxID=1869214 RepID=UPI00307F49F3
MTVRFQKTAVALAMAQILFAQPLLAQQQDTEQTAKKAEPSIEVIEVRGFGASLSKSLMQKKLAESTVEIVTTDDLGQLPDVTITDSLARLPGIAAERDRGNASSISIRGLGARLNAATMNGREIVSAEPSRDVRYEQFPAELINSVEVYKSPLASNLEGGIAGLVNMNFISPLAKDKRMITITGNLMDYPMADDLPGADGTGKKGSFSYVDQWTDNFGVVFGLTYQDQPSVQRETASYSYNKTDADMGDVNGDGIKEVAPWGGKAGTKMGNNERVGSLMILEWQPTDALNFKYDLFYSEFDIKEREDQFWFDGWGNWQDSSNWNYNNSATAPTIVTNADGSQQITGGGLLWGAHSANNATWFQKNDLLSTGLKTTFTGDVWTSTLDIGYSEASIESRWVNLTSAYNGPTPLDISWSNAGGRLGIWVNEDIGNPDYYTLTGMTVDTDRDLTDEMVSVRTDFERGLDWGVVESLVLGLRYSDRDKDNDVQSWWQPVTNSGLTDYGVSYSMGGDFTAPALYGMKNWDQVVSDAFGGIDNRSEHEKTDTDRVSSWHVTETNTAAYAMFRMAGELGDLPYTGNFGVRYVRTDSTSSGYQFKDGVYSPVSVDHDYDEILPALNMIFNLSDEAQVRFGLSRALSRPPLIEMRSGFQLDAQSPVKTGSGGNPSLDPFVANQVDLGFEYYWSEKHAFSASTFFKDLTTHIGSATEPVTIDGVVYQFTGPINGEGGQIKGIELMYQRALDMLPEPFDGLGFYANYSLTDSNVYEFVPADNPMPLGGLSKHVGSLTLWYYKAGYDAKLSYNYRSANTRVGSWTPTEITRADAEATLDASLSYEVTENFKVMLQGQNLTNEPAVTYFDNDPSRPANYTEWGRRFLLGFQLNM